jgi:hypothetical protein
VHARGGHSAVQKNIDLENVEAAAQGAGLAKKWNKETITFGRHSVAYSMGLMGAEPIYM